MSTVLPSQKSIASSQSYKINIDPNKETSSKSNTPSSSPKKRKKPKFQKSKSISRMFLRGKKEADDLLEKFVLELSHIPEYKVVIGSKKKNNNQKIVHRRSSKILNHMFGIPLIKERKVHDTRNRLQKICSSCLIYPESLFQVTWMLQIIVLILFYLVTVPIRMGFANTTDSDYVNTVGVWFSLDLYSDITFILDIIVSFLTVYRRKDGELETSHREIAKSYLARWFILDLAASFPMTIFGADSAGINKVLRVLRIFKLLRIFRMEKALKALDLDLIFKFNPGVTRAFQLVFVLIVIIHFIACAYWGVANLEKFCDWDQYTSITQEIDNSTTQQYNFNTKYYHALETQQSSSHTSSTSSTSSTSHTSMSVSNQSSSLFTPSQIFSGYEDPPGNEPNARPTGFHTCHADWVPWIRLKESKNFGLQYGQSFFWAVVVTTGKGKPIFPRTQLQTAFTSVAVIFGVLFYAVIIGSLSSAIHNMDIQGAAQRQKMDSLNSYLQRNNVPRILARRIRDYYEYIWVNHQKDGGDGGVLKDLPGSMKMRLKVAQNHNRIRSIPVFTDVPQECVLALIERLRSTIAVPGEYVVNCGDKSKAMYIIEHGKVAVFLPKGGRRLSFTGNIRDGMSLSAEEVKKQKLGWRSELKRMQWRAKGETFVKELKKGDFFGEETILKEEQATSVRAMTYCDLLVLSDQHLEEVVEDFRSLATAIAKTLEHREDERASIDKHERRRLKQRRTSRANSFTGLVDTHSGIDMGAAAARAAASVAAAQMQGSNKSNNATNNTTSMPADVQAAIAAASAAAMSNISKNGRGGDSGRMGTRGKRAPSRKLSFVNTGEFEAGSGNMQVDAAAAAAAAVDAAQAAMRSGSGLQLSPKIVEKKTPSIYAVQKTTSVADVAATPIDRTEIIGLSSKMSDNNTMNEMLARQVSVENMVQRMDNRMERLENLLVRLIDNQSQSNNNNNNKNRSPTNIRGSYSNSKSDDDMAMDKILADVKSSDDSLKRMTSL